MRFPVSATFLLAFLAAASPAAAAAADVVIRVESFTASYALEDWMREAPDADAESVPFVLSNPYWTTLNASPNASISWGYALEARARIENATGGAADGDFVMDARVPTPHGDVPAVVAKMGGGLFRVALDLDGATAAAIPPLAPGAHELLLEAWERGTASGEPVAVARVPFHVASAGVDAAAFPLPDALLPFYGDVAGGGLVPVAQRSVRPNESVIGAAAFTRLSEAAANASARVVAVHARHATEVWSGLTDASGRIAFDVTPSIALGHAESGLVLVEAHLTGEGEDRLLGSVVLAVPASPHDARVVGVTHETDDSGSEVVRVTVSTGGTADALRNPLRGVLHAIRGGGVIASAPLAPQGRALDATMDAAPTAGSASYGLVAFVTREDGDVHAFASARRGLDAVVAPLTVEPRAQAALRVVVRNLNDNLDNHTDPGLQTTVSVRVAGLPGAAASVVHEITLDEGSEGVVDVPLPAGRAPGEYAVTVDAVAGDVRVSRATSVAVVEPASALQEMVARVPPPAVGAALAAMGAAALAARVTAPSGTDRGRVGRLR